MNADNKGLELSTLQLCKVLVLCHRLVKGGTYFFRHGLMDLQLSSET